MSDFVAALPMYDFPETRAQSDDCWARLRDGLRAAGIDAPDALTRDTDDLHALWRHPKLLFAQTCWGPMEQGLAEHVHVVGQPDYSAFDGGAGELYSSAIVMRREGALPDQSQRPVAATPPSALPGISPSRGEIRSFTPTARLATPMIGDNQADGLISPLEGEMAGRPEGGTRAPNGGDAALPLDLMRGKRFAYNGPDSMSGLLALSRDLKATGETIDIFFERIETGGHRLSAMAVADGRADVCALDCRSWDMIRRYDAFADGLMAVGWTRRRKGLPLICSRAMPEATVQTLRHILTRPR